MWTVAWLNLIPLIAVIADTAGVNLQMEYVFYFHGVLQVALLSLMLWTGISLSLQGFRPAKFFVMAWVFLLIGILIYFLSQIPSLLPLNSITRHSIMIGISIEILLLSLAVGDKFRVLREQGLQAERRALALESTQKEKLEQQVIERTTELQFAMKKIELLARTDDLTRLLNRRAFNEALEEKVMQAAANHQPIALVMIDVDHFKPFNDANGHLAGDHALHAVATALTSSLRPGKDMAFRLGGEEFAVLMTGVDSLETARDIAESCRTHVMALSIRHSHNTLGIVTISCGVSYQQHASPDSIDTLYKEADMALYDAKQKGRNRTHAFTHPPSPAA